MISRNVQLVFSPIEVQTKMNRLWCLLLLIPASIAVPLTVSRPCATNDYRCVGGYLAANSGCNPNVVGAIPSNYTISSFLFETPYFNSTYIDTQLSIANHDKCYLSEFYFNLKSNTLVIAVRCPGLIFQSTRMLIQHYAEREDVVYNYVYSGTYPEVIITANLRPSSAINLCNSQAFTYVSALPDFYINPNDKSTADFLTKDLTYLQIYERETFFYRGNELIRFFINTILCDFGCDF